ncbi:hypothetical protein PM082_024345 [Marasmius tenuissimus]|nr:hypothetical protein PM082_024345 [Marasmius tenuissimus]
MAGGRTNSESEGKETIILYVYHKWEERETRKKLNEWEKTRMSTEGWVRVSDGRESTMSNSKTKCLIIRAEQKSSEINKRKKTCVSEAGLGRGAELASPPFPAIKQGFDQDFRVETLTADGILEVTVRVMLILVTRLRGSDIQSQGHAMEGECLATSKTHPREVHQVAGP